MTLAEGGIDIGPLLAEYRRAVDGELAERLAAWPPNFAQVQVHEVIGGMIARQATLAKEIANAPDLWNGHSAPILLRAMADAHINMAWLLLDPAIRCLKFISFGLGQAKLELEHRRAQMGDREPTAEEADMPEVQERWIDSQRIRFLQDVDLGKWSGLSVRQMAEEAGCIDFYNYVYTPFSSCAHSMWQHIGHYNLVTCENPLHRYHRLPTSADHDPSLDYMILAAKYWNKTLRVFDQAIGFNRTGVSAFDAFVKAVATDTVN
ncbi:DUF5677 domain-containing protein [Brevundimonas sp. Leaf280]|uniref:DUF5677 domain-containing protein n=1 Tax=Brevundimonas sp. Leaf280 TaxID=1736320 RepID=UPI000AFEE6C1|nr:DUF5677 domain-containing protein [Brevundimonas sp. Leaf280]